MSMPKTINKASFIDLKKSPLTSVDKFHHKKVNGTMKKLQKGKKK